MGLFNKKKNAEPEIRRPTVNDTVVNVTISKGPYYLESKAFSPYSLELLNKEGNGIAFVPRTITHRFKHLVDVYSEDMGKKVAERALKIVAIENDTDFPIPNIVFTFRDVDSNEKQSVVYTANGNVTVDIYYVEKEQIEEFDPIYNAVLVLEKDVDYSGYETFKYTD